MKYLKIFENYISTKGIDVVGRDIPNWGGATVYHSTDKKSAENIKLHGYKILGKEQGGYYGKAISFTTDLEYTKNFGDITTVAEISSSVKILNTNDPDDWVIYMKIINDKNTQTIGLKLKQAGYDGLYDPGAGDLFIFNPVVVKYVGII